MIRQPERWGLALPLVFAAGLVLGLPGAHAVAADAPNGIDWSQLKPGDDWSSQVLHSIFPTTASTVIGTMLKWVSVFAAGLGATWVTYASYLQIHRTSETGKVVSASFSAWAPIKLVWALVLLLPVQNGYSFGQLAVLEIADAGIGLQRSVESTALDAIGPQALPLAEPIIPGTQSVVAGVMASELCRALVNQVANNPNLVPAPTPTPGDNYLDVNYRTISGNGTVYPTCGAVGMAVPAQVAMNSSLVDWTTLASGQKQALINLIAAVRPRMEAIAASMWASRDGSYLSGMDAVLVDETRAYTDALTTAASDAVAAVRSKGRQQDDPGVAALQALGWTGLGAYYLEIGNLNSELLSLTSIVPETTPPNWEGLGQGMMTDLAPFITLIDGYQKQEASRLATVDVASAPGGSASLFSGSASSGDGGGAMDRAMKAAGLSNGLLTAIVNHIVAPSSGSGWTDPLGNMVALGHLLIHIALLIIGGAALLSSKTGSAGAAVASALTGNIPGAVAAVGATAFSGVIKALLGPLFAAAAGLLLPGITLAYVLPMMPYMYWLAGVAGWYVLVIEAVVGVPLWALAHLTFAGEGLHGRGLRGYEYLVTIAFRPTMMTIGLMLSYTVFSAMSWLAMKSFTVATGFVLAQGYLSDNLIGVIVLLCAFVTLEMTFATMSFRLISTLPHHIVSLLNMTPLGRVDSDDFTEKTTGRGIADATEKVRKLSEESAQGVGQAIAGGQRK